MFVLIYWFLHVCLATVSENHFFSVLKLLISMTLQSAYCVNRKGRGSWKNGEEWEKLWSMKINSKSPH